MAEKKPSQLEALTAETLPSKGQEFFPIFYTGKNYTITLAELKKYIGTGGSGGGSSVDLTSVDSNILPDSNNQHVLGNDEYAWKSLYIADSIVFNGTKGTISGAININGSLTINNLAVAMKSSLDHVAGVVDDIDNRLGKIEAGNLDIDLSDYYTKDEANNKFVDSSVLSNYMSYRNDYTISGTHTYNSGKLKVEGYAFGTSSSGLTIDGGLIQTSLNSYTKSDIDNMIASMATAGKLGGMLNITDKTAIQNAQKSLTSTNQVVYYIITDSSGKLPSKQTCFDLSADNIKQLSLTSPNALTNATLSLVHGSVTMNPIGVNVGDMIALTRVKVKVSDLTEALGISLSLSGEIEMYQYRIISFNDAKAPNTNGITNGVMGLMTPSDKAEVSKIGGIEWTANHVRDNYLPKADLLPSIWGTNMNDCLATGVYPWCTLGRPSGSIGAYTCIVKRTSTNDGSYDTIEQTAYGRQEELGRVFKRIIFYRTDGGDTQYGDWIELGGSNSDYLTKAQADGYYLPLKTIDTVVTHGSSNLITSGAVENRVRTFEEEISNRGYLTFYLADEYYLSKTNAIQFGSTATFKNNTPLYWMNSSNSGAHIAMYVTNANQLLIGYGTSQASMPTYIDGNEIYLRYGTSHATAIHISNAGNTTINGYTYIGSTTNTAYIPLVFRRLEHGLSLNNTADSGYIAFGELQNSGASVKAEKVLRIGDSGLQYGILNSTTGNIEYYDILTSVGGTIYGSLSVTGTITIGGSRLFTEADLISINGAINNKANKSDVIPWSNVGIYSTVVSPHTPSNPPSNRWYIVQKMTGNGDNLMVNVPWDISSKQDTISDLATIRSNAANGNTAYGWGNHKNAGYLTSHQTLYSLSFFSGKPDLGSGKSYSPTSSSTTSINIPTKTSHLTNDSNFVTSDQVPLMFVDKTINIDDFGVEGFIGGSLLNATGTHPDNKSKFNSAFFTFGGVEHSIQLLSEHDGNLWYRTGEMTDYSEWHKVLTQSTADSIYLKKNGNISLGTNKITGNADVDIVNSVGNWVILGNGVAASGWPTYIDGNEIYLRYGTSHATAIHISNAGNTTINGNLSVTGVLTATTFSPSKLKIPSTTNNYEFVLEDSSGAIFRPNGTYRAYVGTQNYAFYQMFTTAGFTQTSDATKKNILGNTELTLSQIANAPAVDFTWRDSGEKSVGTIAQYWKNVLPEVVVGEEGSMGLNYATLGVVASIVIARSVETNAQRIARLEMEIESLQKELASLNKSA